MIRLQTLLHQRGSILQIGVHWALFPAFLVAVLAVTNGVHGNDILPLRDVAFVLLAYGGGRLIITVILKALL